MNIFGSIKDAIAKYAEVYIKLLKVNVIGKTSGLVAYVMYAFIFLLLFFCAMILFGFAVTEGLCALGLPRVASFFITFGLYLLMMVLLGIWRRSITGFFTNTFIRILTEGDNENNEDK